MSKKPSPLELQLREKLKNQAPKKLGETKRFKRPKPSQSSYLPKKHKGFKLIRDWSGELDDKDYRFGFYGKSWEESMREKVFRVLTFDVATGKQLDEPWEDIPSPGIGEWTYVDTDNDGFFLYRKK